MGVTAQGAGAKATAEAQGEAKGASSAERDTLTRRLVRRVRAMDVAAVDLAAAERYVRDWLGSYVAGGAAPTGRILREQGGDAHDLEGKVFLAAALSHVTETDDLHNASVTHPACVVVPIALLLGRERKARGHGALHATLVGYEVMTRVGEALGPAHYRIFHNTATAGVFGAAAAAAWLLDLDEDAWVWALGNAGTQAAGLWQFNDEGAMTKPLHAGHAAAAGLRAARLAAHGFTGAEAILEGDKGFFRALCPDARPGAVLADAPGWKLPETSMKPYPCCRHTHPAIDAALETRTRIGLGVADPADASASPTSADAIAAVRIQSYPAALDVTDRPLPKSPHEARFSLQYTVATTLLRGRPGLETFEPEAVVDPAVQALLGRTSVASSDVLATAYPTRWGSVVEVELGDGAVHRIERDSATGDPARPLDDRALDAKVEGLFAWADLHPALRRSLLRACRELVDDGPIFALPD